MQYFSTRNNELNETFNHVLFQGLSKEGGLYMPIKWPELNIETLRDKTYEEVALNIIHPFLKNEISEEELYKIISDTYKNFTNENKAPLVKLDLNKYILELFYGPTLAFKDYAMQFLGNLFSFIMSKNNNNVTILGATSGDTGSAAINAFKSKQNISVYILHPNNKVSAVQRRQMTTILDDNIHNIAIDGSFDDCQRIVKQLFLDEELQSKTSLTAVNSINFARLIAQVVYFFWAYLQLEESKVSFIVPSGNFGNIYSAHIAQNMGLPIERLHIATNENDILHNIISSGKIKIEQVKQTFSPSMDIQLPSNFERQIFELFDYNSKEVKNIMDIILTKSEYSFSNEIRNKLSQIYDSSSVSNGMTLETIKKVKENYNYLSDPHTATGLSVLLENKSDHPFISLACAHPAKFGDTIKKALNIDLSLPKEIENIFEKEENIHILSNNSRDVKNFILGTS